MKLCQLLLNFFLFFGMLQSAMAQEPSPSYEQEVSISSSYPNESSEHIGETTSVKTVQGEAALAEKYEKGASNEPTESFSEPSATHTPHFDESEMMEGTYPVETPLPWGVYSGPPTTPYPEIEVTIESMPPVPSSSTDFDFSGPPVATQSETPRPLVSPTPAPSSSDTVTPSPSPTASASTTPTPSSTPSPMPDCAADTDGDGSNDCEDECPLNPRKQIAGYCGCDKKLHSYEDGVIGCVPDSCASTWDRCSPSGEPPQAQCCSGRECRLFASENDEDPSSWFCCVSPGDTAFEAGDCCDRSNTVMHNKCCYRPGTQQTVERDSVMAVMNAEYCSSNQECCGWNARCEKDAGQANGKCCLQAGGSCRSDDECCTHFQCNTEQWVCELAPAPTPACEGQICSLDSQCCDGFTCVAGACQKNKVCCGCAYYIDSTNLTCGQKDTMAECTATSDDCSWINEEAHCEAMNPENSGECDLDEAACRAMNGACRWREERYHCQNRFVQICRWFLEARSCDDVQVGTMRIENGQYDLNLTYPDDCTSGRFWYAGHGNSHLCQSYLDQTFDLKGNLRDFCSQTNACSLFSDLDFAAGLVQDHLRGDDGQYRLTGNMILGIDSSAGYPVDQFKTPVTFCQSEGNFEILMETCHQDCTRCNSSQTRPGSNTWTCMSAEERVVEQSCCPAELREHPGVVPNFSVWVTGERCPDPQTLIQPAILNEVKFIEDETFELLLSEREVATFESDCTQRGGETIEFPSQASYSTTNRSCWIEGEVDGGRHRLSWYTNGFTYRNASLPTISECEQMLSEDPDIAYDRETRTCNCKQSEPRCSNCRIFLSGEVWLQCVDMDRGPYCPLQ